MSACPEPKSKGTVSWPKAERPRVRLLAEGVKKLTEAELLAIILRVRQGTFKCRILRALAMAFQAHWHSRLTSSGFSETEIEELMLMSGDY